MISIVIVYYRRAKQLMRTLESIAKTSVMNYNVIIVNDDKDRLLALDESFPFECHVLNMEDKDWTLHTIAYNRGFQKAISLGADKIILQGAECEHIGDILKYTERFLTDDNYISFPCFSLDEKSSDYNSMGELERIMQHNNKAVTDNGQNGWYNHMTIRPCFYDFCSAITTNNLKRLNGMDERYAYGYAWGDEDWIRRVNMMGLDCTIPVRPFVVHQWHYNGDYVHPHSNEKLWKRNKGLLDGVTDFRAQHLKTEDF